MKDSKLVPTIIFTLFMSCVSLAFGIAYYKSELEIKELKLTDVRLKTDRIIKHKTEEIAKKEQTLKNVLNSQLHEYTVIDDRYIIRVPIYNMKRIKGPMYVYDIGYRTSTVYHVNKHSNLRQPVFNELLYKFE